MTAVRGMSYNYNQVNTQSGHYWAQNDPFGVLDIESSLEAGLHPNTNPLGWLIETHEEFEVGGTVTIDAATGKITLFPEVVSPPYELTGPDIQKEQGLIVRLWTANAADHFNVKAQVFKKVFVNEGWQELPPDAVPILEVDISDNFTWEALQYFVPQRC